MSHLLVVCLTQGRSQGGAQGARAPPLSCRAMTSYECRHATRGVYLLRCLRYWEKHEYSLAKALQAFHSNVNMEVIELVLWQTAYYIQELSCYMQILYLPIVMYGDGVCCCLHVTYIV